MSKKYQYYFLSFLSFTFRQLNLSSFHSEFSLSFVEFSVFLLHRLLFLGDLWCFEDPEDSLFLLSECELSLIHI